MVLSIEDADVGCPVPVVAIRSAAPPRPTKDADVGCPVPVVATSHVGQRKFPETARVMVTSASRFVLLRQLSIRRPYQLSIRRPYQLSIRRPYQLSIQRPYQLSIHQSIQRSYQLSIHQAPLLLRLHQLSILRPYQLGIQRSPLPGLTRILCLARLAARRRRARRLAVASSR